MYNRKKLTKRTSRKKFRRNASIHRANLKPKPYRGGGRL